MIYSSLIRGMINLSSHVQTYLINYLEFHGEPREIREKGYQSFSARPEKPEEVLIPFQKEQVIKPHYTILLALAKEQGREIRPIQKRSCDLRSGEKQCRTCNAPQEYLKNHGYYRKKSTGECFPKHTCKVCLAEYAPQAKRKKPKHICPYCGYAMSVQKYRSNFLVFVCKQEGCGHQDLHPQGYRYHEREWHFEYDELKTHGIYSKKSLEKTRMNKQLLNLEMSLFVGNGISARETKTILHQVYGVQAVDSHQSILNHAEALAAFIKEREHLLPAPEVRRVAEDETYVKYAGRWGYLFRAFDPDSRGIIAEYFSVHRDAKSCIILNKMVRETCLKQRKDPEFEVISDGAPLYPAMQNYFEDTARATIHHTVVQGLFPDASTSEDPLHRSTKQKIERSFGTLKSAIRRRRGFSSFRGAEIFCFLHKVFYNHLRPHTERQHQPPLPLFLKNGTQVSCWTELIQFLTERSR